MRNFKSSIPFLAYFISISPFLFYFINREFTPGFDWGYFNSLGFLYKSHILQFKIPLIDLKICGGHDLVANPQGYFFSPLIFLNLFLNPYLANVFSLILMASLSFIFMRKIFLLNNAPLLSSLGATLFNLCSFFSLHFAEGHIPYRSFYLLPALYFLTIERISLKNLKWGALLITLSLLDGGMYFVFFYLFFFIFSMAMRYNKLQVYKNFFSKNSMMFIFGLLLILGAKFYPVLFLHGKREPLFDQNIFTDFNLLRSLFDITQTNLDQLGDFPYRAHENTCYVTISLFILFILSFFKKTKEKILYFYAGFSFWIYSGWGGALNPWSLFKLIPIINNAHIQSRFIIFFFFFFLLIALNAKINKKLKYTLVTIGILELFIQNVIVFDSLWTKSKLIPVNLYKNYRPFKNKKSYENYIPKPWIYNQDALSYSCYEPASSKNLLQSLNIVFPYDRKQGVSQESLDEFSIHSMGKESLLLNMKYNAGWDCDHCTVRNEKGLIRVDFKVKSKDIRATLKYNPFYTPVIFLLLIFGILISIFYFRRE